MLEYYSGSECVRIEEDNNGKWWITYGVGYSPATCGFFTSEKEATQTLKKHRPEAKFYRVF